ncbi:MAG: nucleoside-diphosphate kinase [Candidatus Micrarchaeaceae archaeon]
MIERTLVLVKPEGVYRALIGKVITTFEEAGLKVVGIKMVRPDKDLAGKHYAADEEWMLSIGRKANEAALKKGLKITESEIEIGKRVRANLLKHLTSGPVVAMAIEGNEAVYVVRKLTGSTEPRSADPSSIRGRYGVDSYEMGDLKSRPVKNIVHASENEKAAKKELALWFKKSELVDYHRVDEEHIY